MIILEAGGGEKAIFSAGHLQCGGQHSMLVSGASIVLTL